MLWGGIGSRPKPSRLPRIIQRIRADHPEDMCTTVPPAKSMALMAAFGFHTPFINPLMPHTMWASGKYTTNIHRIMNSSRAVSYTHLRAHETRHDLVCRL